jgi:hypothetical protein
MLWYRVLLMLQCWKVLVPLQMMDDFEVVSSSLEQLIKRPELIAPPLSVGDPTDPVPNDVGGT